MTETWTEKLKRWDTEWLAAFRAAGHDPAMFDDGDGSEVNMYAIENGFHNGPFCEKCHFAACVNCMKPEDIPQCK